MTNKEAIEIFKDRLRLAEKYQYVSELHGYDEAIRMAISALKSTVDSSTETVDTPTDYISRQAAIDEFPEDNLDWDTMDGYVAPHFVRKILQQLPFAQPERKKGKWIKTGQSFVFPEKFRNYSCSECGYDVDKTKFNFCPNCGAMMEVQDEIV